MYELLAVFCMKLHIFLSVPDIGLGIVVFIFFQLFVPQKFVIEFEEKNYAQFSFLFQEIIYNCFRKCVIQRN